LPEYEIFVGDCTKTLIANLGELMVGTLLHHSVSTDFIITTKKETSLMILF